MGPLGPKGAPYLALLGPPGPRAKGQGPRAWGPGPPRQGGKPPRHPPGGEGAQSPKHVFSTKETGNPRLLQVRGSSAHITPAVTKVAPWKWPSNYSLLAGAPEQLISMEKGANRGDTPPPGGGVLRQLEPRNRGGGGREPGPGSGPGPRARGQVGKQEGKPGPARASKGKQEQARASQEPRKQVKMTGKAS